MMYPLWARINGKDYPITYGSVVTDTFSETLDSATIIIPHVNEIIDIKPYDDVIIHSAEWDESQGKQVQWCEANHHFQEVYQQGEANANSLHSPVYRHMLCESPNRRQVNYNDYYTYTLTCVSETKGLEFPQMPNRTITQPKVSDVTLVGELDADPIVQENTRNFPISGYDAEINLGSGYIILLFGVYLDSQNIKWAYSWLAIPNNPPYEDGGSGILENANGASKELTFNGTNLSVFLRVRDGKLYGEDASWTISDPASDNYISVSDFPKKTTTITISGPKSIYFWINTFVETYSPKIKYTADGETWAYRNKYVLSSDVQSKFGSTKCPEMTFGGTTLREALTKLMNVLDCIPVVHDNVITFLDMSSRNATFSDRREEMREILENEYNVSSENIETKYPSFCDHEGKDQIPNQGWQNWMMSGGEYADRLRTEYHGGISEQNSTRYVEKLGFRNKNVSAMTLENLQLELSHPIYKINKIYLEYYKKDVEDPDNKAVLVKYDITPLVKLNSERQMLSHDWTEIANNKTFEDYNKDGFLDINDFARYYFFTVGYNIGSTVISGWGETLNFSKEGILSQQHSTLENIIVIASMLSYYGNVSISSLPLQEGNQSSMDVAKYGIVSNIGWNEGSGYSAIKELAENIVTPAGEDSVREDFIDLLKEKVNWLSNLFTGAPALTDYTPVLKSVFFEVDYEGMIEGAVISTKDYHDGSVVRRDAVSSALSVVETAGALEKQKANKLGNATLVTNQRISDPRFLMQIGDYDKDDMIVYQRTVSYTRDYLNVTYYQCKDYVLKNYYTSVYSKIRPFSLTSYEESVTRNENHYQVALFSTTQFYYQESSENFDKGYEVADVISFLLPNAVFSWDVSKAQDTTPIVWKDEENPTRYLLERQNFVSGNSLCAVFTMPDSVSMGTYITNWNPSVNQYLKEKYFMEDPTELRDLDAIGYESNNKFLQELTGTIQDWHMIQTGVEPIDICFSELILDSTNDVFGDDGTTRDIDDVMNESSDNKIYKKIMQLPKLPYDYDSSKEKIRFTDTAKDQKERLNSTAQLEFVSDSNDIFVTQWAARLSDANGTKMKSWAYKQDSIIWFWIIQTAYATAGQNTPVRYGDPKISYSGIIFETDDENYTRYDITSVASVGWGNTGGIQNPCIAFPVLMVAVNNESQSVMAELAKHDSSNPFVVDDLTVTWGNHSVKVVNIVFNENAVATSMTIQINGTNRTVSMVDLNDTNYLSSLGEYTRVTDDPQLNSSLVYKGYSKFDIMKIRKANSLVEYASGTGDYTNLYFIGSLFNNFKISQTQRMWLSNQTVKDFMVDSTQLGDEYAVFMYVKYAFIHMGVIHDVSGSNLISSGIYGLANPEAIKADYAVQNLAFANFQSSSNTNIYDIASLYEQQRRVFVRGWKNGSNESFPFDWAYSSDCGNGNSISKTGRIQAARIEKIANDSGSMDSGSLFITYSPDKVDAKIADRLVSTDSIPSDDIQLYGVTLFGNDQSVELENRATLLAQIRRNAGSSILLKAKFSQGEDVQNGGSIRVYYKDSAKNGDGLFHLVFALNTYTVYSDYILAQFSVSILDDRSKTVIDEHGEPLYRIVNYIGDEDAPDELGNYCVKK